MRNGPEFGKGWSRTLDVEGAKVRIEALHVTRRRAPRGHEIVKQMTRGGVWKMVEETHYSWRVLTPADRQPTEIRANPNGTFYLPALQSHHRSVEEAATAYARHRLALDDGRHGPKM